MKRLLLLIALSFSSAYATEATLNCPGTAFNQIYAITNLIDRNVVTEDLVPMITCKEAQFFSEVIVDINQMITPYLTAPAIGLSLSPSSDEAMFIDLISMPVNLLIEEIAKNPIFTQYAAAHEYGHALFRENMKYSTYRFENYDQYVELGRKYHQSELRKNELGIRYVNIEAQMEKLPKDSPEFQKLNEQLTQINTEMEQIIESMYELEGNEENNTMLMKDSINAPYNELFADTTAVLYSYSGSAISDALFRTKLWSEKFLGYQEDTYGRDFTDKKNRLDQNWKIKQDIYGIFAPVRYHLYERYLDEHLRKDKEGSFRGRFLQSLFKAIAKETKKTADFFASKKSENAFFDYDNLSDQEIIELNRSLILSIDNQFIEDKILR